MEPYIGRGEGERGGLMGANATLYSRATTVIQIWGTYAASVLALL